MQKVIHSGEGVQFMTLHGSKGLEFDTVFMIGNDHKTWTSSVRSRFKLPPRPDVLHSTFDTEDARRLFYVGNPTETAPIYLIPTSKQHE